MEEDYSYTLPPYSEGRNYEKYPNRTVNYRENEPLIGCDYCFRQFSTDAKRISYDDYGRKLITYAAANKFIVYLRGVNRNICVDTDPCLKKQATLKQAQEEKDRALKEQEKQRSIITVK